MTKEDTKGKKKWFRMRRGKEKIDSYIPHYLRNLVHPYHGDFCFSRVFHYKLISQLCSEGFLTIASEGVLLPKLHKQRCVVSLPEDLHVSKSTRKKSKRFKLTVNKAFGNVIEGCQKQHGDRCWLYPPLVRAFGEMNKRGKVDADVFEDSGRKPTGRVCPVRLYSIEIWDLEDKLVAGELGYTVGSVYTSLTGFSSQDSAGSVQLAALGRLLSSLGFSLWDLGMEMDYKFGLGCKSIPRQTFLDHILDVREKKGHLVLPTNQPFNAKALIDQEAALDGLDNSNGIVDDQVQPARSPSEKHQSSPAGTPREKKRSKNADTLYNC